MRNQVELHVANPEDVRGRCFQQLEEGFAELAPREWANQAEFARHIGASTPFDNQKALDARQPPSQCPAEPVTREAAIGAVHDDDARLQIPGKLQAFNLGARRSDDIPIALELLPNLAVAAVGTANVEDVDRSRFGFVSGHRVTFQQSASR
jgi:hypothetical protein